MQKNIILDATLLSSLMSCARLTDFKFNHNFQPIGGKSNSLECGSMVHVILEVYNKSLILGKSRADSISAGMNAGLKYVEYGDAGVVTTLEFGIVLSLPNGVDAQPLQNTPADNETSPSRIGYNYVIDTMNQYFDFYKSDTWTPVQVEYVKSMLIYEDESLRILWKAKLDLTVDTNDGIYPVDHKTMKQRRDSLSLNNQFMGQCLVTKTRQVIIDKIGFQASLKPREKFTRPMISYSLNRLTEWSQVIVPYYARLFVEYDQTGYWPPNFTHCENKYGFCPFKDVCSTDTTMREEELRINFEIGKKWDPTND